MTRIKKVEEKGIFLLYEGLPRTIIESQVIAHVKKMRKEGVDIEVWSYCVTEESYVNAQEMLKKLNNQNIPIKVFRGFRPALPFSEVLNAILLKHHLTKKKFNPSFIRCRTEYSASVAGFLKLTGKFTLIWDCRGDSEEEFLLQRKQWGGIKRMLSFTKLYAIRTRLFWVSKQADEAIFVSESLKKLHAKRNHSYRSSVIPCVADSTCFYFDPTLRSNMRKHLNLNPSDKVVIYSGSLAVWQCFRETFCLIKKFINQGTNFKAIILSPDLKALRESFGDCPVEKLLCISASLTEVNAYLNAADYSLLLRRPGPINRVASPVKFAEYCLAGLPIIMTNAVEQSYQLANQFGNAITYAFGQELTWPDIFTDAERSQIAEQAKSVLSHESVSNKYREIYCGEVSTQQCKGML